MPLSKNRLDLLTDNASSKVLLDITRGIEKESLRVTKAGEIAKTPHSHLLGAALTHPQITTDFSEALLEFITPPSTDANEVLKILEDAHCFTYKNIGDEVLWTSSMPCQLSGESSIPVGVYGSSNIGEMKHTYRLGLGHRYGKLMQTIAGIHYNFSVPDDLMEMFRSNENSKVSFEVFKTDNYFSLIRNFRRNYWLLLYLFGASPAICRSFAKNRGHRLIEFGEDEHSLHLPYATSLRMSDLGYQSKNQDNLMICYNSLDSYVKTLREVLVKPNPSYELIGLKDALGKYKQLNVNVLQIENEFYSPIRPKRSADPGETPLQALSKKGVEYIEVRCLDLNPFLPLGIDREQIDFMDVFLMTCLLSKSAPTDQEEHYRILKNQKIMVYQGRSPNLMLHDKYKSRTFRDWGHSIFEKMYPVAALFDQQKQTSRYSEALKKLERLIDRPSLTPSAKILDTMRQNKKSYFQVAMDHALKTRKHILSTELSAESIKRYEEMAVQSLKSQRAIEAADDIPFDKFLENYHQQYNMDL